MAEFNFKSFLEKVTDTALAVYEAKNTPKVGAVYETKNATAPTIEAGQPAPLVAAHNPMAYALGGGSDLLKIAGIGLIGIIGLALAMKALK